MLEAFTAEAPYITLWLMALWWVLGGDISGAL